MEDAKETRPFRHNRTDINTNSQRKSTQIGALKNTVQELPSLILDNQSQNKNWFSPMKSYWVHKPHLRQVSCPAGGGQYNLNLR